MPSFQKASLRASRPKGASSSTTFLVDPGTQQVQVERLELRSQTLPLREEALRQQFAEGVAVHVKRAVKVRDVRPQVFAIFVGEDFAFLSVEFLRGLQPDGVQFFDRTFLRLLPVRVGLVHAVQAPLEVRKADLADDGVNRAVDLGHDQRQQGHLVPGLR